MSGLIYPIGHPEYLYDKQISGTKSMRVNRNNLSYIENVQNAAFSTTLVKHFQLLFKKMSFELLTRIKISPHHYNVFGSKISIISSSFKSTPVFNRFKRIFLKVFNRV